MKSEWKRVRIADVADVRRGASPRPIHNFLSDEGMPWVKIADATSKNSRYIAKTKEFIKESGVSASVVVVPETLILSNSATPGLPRIMKIQACVHDGWLVFGNYRNVERDFLYYLLTYVRPNLIGLANGSVFQNLKTDIVNRFEISLPPLSYQRKVAAILSSLDDKIENNNAICKNLEEQAAALYKSWFVDFEPYKGRRPEEWKVVKLSEVAAKISDGVHNTIVDVADSYYYLLSCKNIVGGQLKITGNERRIGKRDFMRLRKRTQLSRGDILLSSVGTVGELVLLREEPENFEFQRSVAIIKANSDLVSPDYLFWTLRNMQAAIRAAAHGAVQQCLFLGDIANFDILLPTKEAVNKFNLLVARQGNKIALLEDENKRLASLRDILLPKLMSGEIDVDNCLI